MELEFVEEVRGNAMVDDLKHPPSLTSISYESCGIATVKQVNYGD